MASKLPTVAIIGRANAGKSSLFNRLVKSQQAIVAREAGTTRDNVLGKVTYRNEGKEAQFWLVDTAGLKTAEDDFEASIQEQIEEAAVAADVILVVVDSTQHPGDDERSVAKKALKSKKPVLLITNKADLKTSLPDEDFRRLGISNMIRTSAEHNFGISELLDAIADLVPPATERDADDVLRVALIGRPNVGKSKLFNRLAGKQQAVVADVAGTTRDVNHIQINYHQRTIELLDTAGVRRQGKQEVGIEKFSVLRTLQAIESSDVCLLLMDVNELNTALDQRLAGVIDEAGKGLVIVVSKWDNVDDLRDKAVEAAEELASKQADAEQKSPLTRIEKLKRSKAMKAGQTDIEGKDPFTRDALAAKISYNFKFTPWAPLIFTSSVTGQNVSKLFDLVTDIDARRKQETKTRVLNDLLATATQKHPPAGLKNTHPKLRYMVQTDDSPPWFVIHGSNLKFVHWSYKRYLEKALRDTYDYSGTPIKFSFRDEKQIKANKERIAQGLEPVTKAYKKAKEAEKQQPESGTR
ncbi:MAG: ribosome biogenesis GTPase Der [Patescibacteria group bacterium]